MRVLAADERRQLALARALGAARDGSVDGARAALGELAATRRAVSGAIVEQSSTTAPLRDALGDAARPEHDRLDVGRVRDAEAHELGALRGLARRLGPAAHPRSASACSRSRVRL